MAAPGTSSRFAGVKAFSEKFTQPELDAEGNIKKVRPLVRNRDISFSVARRKRFMCVFSANIY